MLHRDVVDVEQVPCADGVIDGGVFPQGRFQTTGMQQRLTRELLDAVNVVAEQLGQFFVLDRKSVV